MTQMVSELRHDAVTARKTRVTVTASTSSSSPQGVEFTMAADYVDKGGKQEGDKLKFDPGAGPFDLKFDLDDTTSLGLAFYPEFVDAMWVAVGSSCPAGPGDGGGAITPRSVTDRKLNVTNANSVAQTLAFALRFTGTAPGGGKTTYAYDPKIINGGL
jgi:hypothetical protein